MVSTLIAMARKYGKKLPNATAPQGDPEFSSGIRGRANSHIIGGVFLEGTP
jgi:hypothetical protein